MKNRIICLICAIAGVVTHSRVYAQEYLNSFSMRYGLSLPLGEFAGDMRNVNDVVGGMNYGGSWGIEFKSRMFNLKTVKFGEYSSLDYLDNSGMFLLFNQFSSSLSESSKKNIVKNNLEIFEIGGWKVSNLIIGFTHMEYMTDYSFAFFKLGGGLNLIESPYVTLFKNDELGYRRASSNFSTFGAVFGLDFVFDINRIRIQIQNEVLWSNPEIKTATYDYVIGKIDQQKEKASLWMPQFNLSVGYNFGE